MGTIGQGPWARVQGGGPGSAWWLSSLASDYKDPGGRPHSPAFLTPVLSQQAAGQRQLLLTSQGVRALQDKVTNSSLVPNTRDDTFGTQVIHILPTTSSFAYDKY